jgi:hypothetical protein
MKTETDRFIKIQYYIVVDGKPLYMGNDNKFIKKYLIDGLLEFVKQNGKLPYACKYIKAFQNGNIQVDYKPTDWDNFALRVTPEKAEKYNITDLIAYFAQLSSEQKNPLVVHAKRPKDREENNLRKIPSKKYREQKAVETMEEMLSKSGDAVDFIPSPTVTDRNVTDRNGQLDAQNEEMMRDHSDDTDSDAHKEKKTAQKISVSDLPSFE